MAKLTLTDITAGYDTASINAANNTLIEAAVENTLSRDGTGPNTMEANLDMNSYRIQNLPTAVNNTEPVILSQANSLAGVTNPLTQNSIGTTLWPQTSAETTAGVTPTNYYYEPGNVLRYGAAGDGVTDDTAAIQAAVDSNDVVVFPSALSYSVGSVDCSGRAVSIIGYGATIICTSATGAFYKTDHGNLLRIIGITFTGTSTYRAINFQAAVSGTVYNELDVEQCDFDMGSGIFGIYSVGGREHHISRCTFRNTNSGCGIYFKDSVAPYVVNCVFKGTTTTGRGIYYPGTGTAYDAGLIIRDCEIMGWNQGVEIVGCDWLVITGSTIDYNTYSIKVASQDGAQIFGNYIGSVGNNTALWVTSDATASSPNYSDKIIIANNTFTGHYTTDSTYDTITIDGGVSPDGIQIVNNNITFYTRYGISFTTTGRILITGNLFAQLSGKGVSPIYNTSGTGDSGVRIRDNHFSNAATLSDLNLSFAQVSQNYGMTTEAEGTGNIESGSTSDVITHGLSGTPAGADITITPTGATTSPPGHIYITSVGATTFTVNCAADPGASGMLFSWKASL